MSAEVVELPETENAARECSYTCNCKAEPTPRKIAIIGKAPSSRHLAPYDDPSWEIWTLSDLVPQGQAPRFDVHFELHPLHWIRPNEPYWQWLTGLCPSDKPVLMAELSADVPAGRRYPIHDVLRYFRRRYFTNTVTYMIALAIMERPAVIGVWGVDMAQTKEYRNQRPSCEWLLGWAEGAGIEVVLPGECDLLKTPFLYGFEHMGSEMRTKWEARNKELHERHRRQAQKIQELDATRQQIVENILRLEGAIDSQEYYEQWSLFSPEFHDDARAPGQ